MHQDLALGHEPTLLRQAHRLTATVLEELGASGFHPGSIDAVYTEVKAALRGDLEVQILVDWAQGRGV